MCRITRATAWLLVASPLWIGCKSSPGTAAISDSTARADAAVAAPSARERDPAMSDPKHVRDRVFAQLSASGAADPERNDVAAVLERVRKSPPPNVHLAATSECYAAGCATEVRIGKAAFHKAQSALVAAVKGYWDGPVFVSGPVPDAGDTISCSLVVYSKDRG